jgi:hypothetical protein
MKIMKTLSVLGSEGYFYEGEFSGTICFVPASAIQAGRLNEALYVAQGWASLNIKAQKPRGGVGSHLFPDLDKPNRHGSLSFNRLQQAGRRSRRRLIMV